MYPALVDSSFSGCLEDQLGFRQTGSCEAAIIVLMDTVTSMLCKEDYVTAMFVDMSKAFDMVSHSRILGKLANMNLCDEVFNWIYDFISDKQHYTYYNGQLSGTRGINCGVIQGSVIGPTLFVVAISDLKPIGNNNHYIKYADDTVVIVPGLVDDTLESEMCNVEKWASDHNLVINSSKTKAIWLTCHRQVIKHMKNMPNVVTLPMLGDLHYSSCINYLGVKIQSKLLFQDHVNNIVDQCNKTFYLM